MNIICNLQQQFSRLSPGTDLDDQGSKSKELLQRVVSYILLEQLLLPAFLLFVSMYMVINKSIWQCWNRIQLRLCKKLKKQVYCTWIQNPRAPMDRESDIFLTWILVIKRVIIAILPHLCTYVMNQLVLVYH